LKIFKYHRPKCQFCT